MNTKMIATVVISISILLAACAGPAATPTASPTTGPTATPAGTATGAPTEAPSATAGGVSGNVDIHGSSTVAPISNAVAEDLQAANPEFSYFVGEEGTGDGFDIFFCVNGADISDASRAIDEEEVALCEENGVEWVELKVAYDGLAVITHPDNAIECVTLADLYSIFGPESDTIGTWADAETLAHSIGSTTEFPDGALSITAPGDESGTYDSFRDLALGDLIEQRAQEERLRIPSEFYVASSNDNAIIQGVGGFPTSIGFVGLAYAELNVDQVKIVQVDGGEGCITPNAETVSDGSYPISRPLFIYPSLNLAAENAAIVAYVDFYLSDEGIDNVGSAFGVDPEGNPIGYVSLPAEELDATRAAWDAAKP